MHGGLSPSIHTLDQLRVLNRFREIPHEGPIADLVWSDPIQLNSALPGADLTSDFAVSPRGAGYTFGELSTHKFLQVNGLGHICRAHQLCMEGYQVRPHVLIIAESNRYTHLQILFNDRLSTVWSAPNYCYRAGNLASVLQIAPNLERLFNIFGPCPEDMRDVPGKPLDEKDGSNSLEDYFV